MKKIKLTAEEKAISEAIERNEFVPVQGKQLENVANAITARKKDTFLPSGNIHRTKKWPRKKD